jgi:hypothetical protein
MGVTDEVEITGNKPSPEDEWKEAIHVEGERIGKEVIDGSINICDGEGEVSGGRGEDNGEREAARGERGERQDVGLLGCDQPSAAAIGIKNGNTGQRGPCLALNLLLSVTSIILFTTPSVLKYKMF